MPFSIHPHRGRNKGVGSHFLTADRVNSHSKCDKDGGRRMSPPGSIRMQRKHAKKGSVWIVADRRVDRFPSSKFGVVVPTGFEPVFKP